MSLNWDVSDCEDHEFLMDENEWPITQSIIFATMAVDIGRIDEGNWREFYARTALIESVQGHSGVIDEHGEVRFTKPIDVKRRIGLHTNVITLDREDWLSKIGDALLDRLQIQANREVEKAEQDS